MICSTCRSQNAENARFCNNCGATLIVSGETETLASAHDESRTLEVTPNDQLMGRVIDGRYRIEGLVGVGGMGSVYRATRVLIGDEVAIKILHTERVADPHAAERFRREAQASARLKHPNAVSIYDFGISSDGLQYLVMELIEGQSLREVMKQQGRLPAPFAAEITAQVCAALDEAHRQHIVHRDIKPDNIILNSTASGLRVKVLDFGIAKLRDDAASHLTQTGSVMGTPHYMSPEQCLGEELDARADIYSMGIVLYEMLCGRVPFSSPISTAVVVQHVNQPPPSLRSINVGISPQIEAAVLHALQKSREARPQTATAFAREVTTATGMVPVHHEDRWSGGIVQPLVSQVTDEERTVERRQRNVFEPQTVPKEMAPTIHLSHISGSTGSLPAARPTTGNGTVSVGILSQAAGHKYAIGGAALVLLTIIGLVSWRTLQGIQTPTNSNRASKTETDATNGPNWPPTGMAYVPGGTFMMGSNQGDLDSRPAHSVTVKPFFIDKYEVTRADYAKFVRETNRRQPLGWLENGTFPPRTERWPVTGVSWDDAIDYAKWAGKRLPTEQEWEFAARGSDGRLYPWGTEWKKEAANAGTTTHGRVGDVGEHSEGASPFGAFDMVGNAWEWTASDWVPYPRGRLQYPPQGDEKVIRGGSWQSSSQYATTVYRSGIARSGDKSGYESTGFRCVKDLQ
jgi:serine/threonine protein kinase